MASLAPLLALALSASRVVVPDGIAQWDPYVLEASRRFGIPADWIRRVIRIESGGVATLHGQPIRSPTGAMGLMQLMPGTWADLRERYALGGDPDDARDNILAGTAYLRLMYERFGYPMVFAAYNAGPGRVEAFRHARASLPRETRLYLASATGATTIRLSTEPRQTLFARVADTAPGSMSTPSALFAVLQ